MEIANVEGVFLLLMVGSVAAIVCSCVEMVFDVRRRSEENKVCGGGGGGGNDKATYSRLLSHRLSKIVCFKPLGFRSLCSQQILIFYSIFTPLLKRPPPTF